MLIKTKDLLREKIETHGGFEVVADKLDCTRENLYNLTSHKSKKKPGLEMALAIQELLGLPVEAWKRTKRHRKAA